MTERRQCAIVLVVRDATEAIVDHVGASAAGSREHRPGEGAAFRDDGHVAAAFAGDPRLLGGRHGPEHARAQRLAPAAQERPDAAGGRVDEHGVTGADAMRTMQKILGGESLQHQCRGSLIVDRVRERNDVRGGQGPHIDVCARFGRDIGHAIAGRKLRDVRADVDHHTRGFHAGRRRRCEQRIASRAHIDVDVVDADRRLPDADLAWARRGCRQRDGDEDFRPAMARHDGPAGRQRLATTARRVGCGRAVPPEIRAKPCEPTLVDVLADETGELALASARRVERGLPVPERALAVGDAFERDGGDVASHRDRRVEDAIGRDVIAVGQRQELLADPVAVAQREVAHASDLVARLATLDLRLGDDRVPRGVAVEIAQDRPHTLDGRVDDCRAGDADHRRNAPFS